MTRDELLSIAKQIIRETAKVGLDSAGSAILPGTWQIFKAALSPVIKNLNKKYPKLFLSDQIGKAEAAKAAEKAVSELSDNRALQDMLLDGFLSLEHGQEEVLNEVRHVGNHIIEVKKMVGELSNEVRMLNQQVVKISIQRGIGPSRLLELPMSKEPTPNISPKQLKQITHLYEKAANLSVHIDEHIELDRDALNAALADAAAEYMLAMHQAGDILKEIQFKFFPGDDQFHYPDMNVLVKLTWQLASLDTNEWRDVFTRFDRKLGEKYDAQLSHLDTALACYGKVLTAQPQNIDALVNCGLAYSARLDFDKGTELLTQARATMK